MYNRKHDVKQISTDPELTRTDQLYLKDTEAWDKTREESRQTRIETENLNPTTEAPDHTEHKTWSPFGEQRPRPDARGRHNSVAHSEEEKRENWTEPASHLHKQVNETWSIYEMLNVVFYSIIEIAKLITTSKWRSSQVLLTEIVKSSTEYYTRN